METKTIVQEVTFSATPNEVFEALMDPEKHAKFTGATAEIQRKPGGKFSLYGGSLTGSVVELEKDRLIVLDWRASDWPSGHYSRLSLSLNPLHGGRGTQLSLIQAGVPAEHFNDISNGWQEYYWSKMAVYFRDEKAAVVMRFVEELKNRHNLAVIDELFAKDFVSHLPLRDLPTGRDGQKAAAMAIFDAFPDVHVTVADIVVEGDRVVERSTVHATHLGEFNGVPATGIDVHWTENHIYRLENGRIAELWSEASFHDLMEQIATAAAKRAA